MKGCTIDIQMDSKPNIKRGIELSDAPYSFSNEKK